MYRLKVSEPAIYGILPGLLNPSFIKDKLDKAESSYYFLNLKEFRLKNLSLLTTF